MMNPNLDAGYPVLLSISGAQGGHGVVCDGYGYNLSTLYHHLNLGWAGSSDAWYNLPNTSTTDYNFDSVNGCAYNVWPAGGGEIISGRVTDAGGTAMAGAKVTAVCSLGTASAMTNAQGIYALAKIPSNTQYTLAASKAGHFFSRKIVSVGESADYSACENRWAVNFAQAGSATITTASPLPSGMCGQAYSQTLAASGGVPGYTWGLGAGSLPAGLSLSSSGLISGTPTAAGTVGFTIRVTGSDGQPSTKAFSITVAPAPTRIVGLGGNMSFGSVAVGSTATAALTISNTGNTALGVVSVSYPPGFAGAWSGSVPAGGEQRVTVTFSPLATKTYTGVVTVKTNATSGSGSISVNGGGIAAPTRIVGVRGSLSFGNITVNSTKTATLTVSNTGNSAMTVSSIAYPSGFSGNWSSGTIAPGSAQNITVTFAPAVVQLYGGDVTVESDKTSGTGALPVSGKGLPVPIPAGVFGGLVGGYQAGTGSEAENMAAFLGGTGFLAVTTKTDGTFTGSLRLEGKSLPLKGKFVEGAAVVVIKRTGKSDAVLTLKVDFAAPGKVSGSVNIGGADMPVQALPSLPKTTIIQIAGQRYTVILPAPDDSIGHGYATLTVAAKGTGTLAGKLADGTIFTTTAQIEDDPTDSTSWLLPVYIPLYAGSGGLLAGEIYLSKSETADVNGSFGWLRPANSAAKIFPSGFLKALAPLGKRYQLTKNISLLTGTTDVGNFTLTLDQSGIVLPSAISQDVTWPASNVPMLTAPVTPGLKLGFAGTTGIFKGTFIRTLNGKPVTTTYDGVVFASSLTLPGEATPVRGGGFFSTGTASGTVEIK